MSNTATTATARRMAAQRYTVRIAHPLVSYYCHEVTAATAAEAARLALADFSKLYNATTTVLEVIQ